VSPLVTGTGFGLNDELPTADEIVTVTLGPAAPGVDGADGEEEPPPQPHISRTAPPIATAVPESNEERMLVSSKGRTGMTTAMKQSMYQQ
jgi:hypothetical protein